MHKVNSISGSINMDELPDKCPFCHKAITPNILFAHRYDRELEVFLYCPDSNCNKSFIGYYDNYDGSSTYKFAKKVSQGKLIGKKFSETIKEISSSFELIFNEAFSAEQQNLSEVCGVGYRKALEFLIKDYLIFNNEKEKTKIEKMQLGNCIKTYVNDNRIKTVAQRAAWIGNDETHYIRKWEGKNLGDLKKLIELTVHWIEMERLTESFEEDMPE